MKTSVCRLLRQEDVVFHRIAVPPQLSYNLVQRGETMLSLLAKKVTTEDMAGLNYAVHVEGGSPSVVADQYLRNNDLVK